MFKLIANQIFHVDYQLLNSEGKKPNTGEKQPVMGKVVLHLPKNAKQTPDKMTAIVDKILNREIKDNHLTSHKHLHTLNIQKITGGTADYICDGKAHQITLDDSDNQDPLLKILSIVEETDVAPIEQIQSQKKGFAAHLTHLWDLFVSALYYLFGKYTDNDLLHLNSLGARYDQSGPERFEQVLSVFRRTIQSKKDGKFGKLLEQLSQAELYSSRIREALKGGTQEIQKLSKELSHTVATKYKENSDKDERYNLATFGLGYYRDNSYHPLLLTFFVEEGKLKMRMVNMDPQLTEIQEGADSALKRLNPIQEFQFETENQQKIEKNIEGMLNVLFPFQVKGKDVADKKVKKRGLKLTGLVQNILDSKVLNAGGNAKAKKDPIAFNPPEMSVMFTDVMAGFGAKVSKSSQILEPYASKKQGDWWKQCFVTCQSLFPDLDLGKKEKIEWEMAYLHNYLDQFDKHTKGWRRLSFDQKKSHLFALERTLEKIEKSYESFYGDHAAFQKIWGANDNLKNELSAIRKKISAVKTKLASERMQELNHPSVKGDDWKATFEISNDIKKVCGKIKRKAAKPSFTVENSKSINTLNDVISDIRDETKTEKIEALRRKFTTTFDEIVKGVDGAFKKKKWSEIYDFIPFLLEQLPPPPIGGTDRFGSKLWSNLSEDEIDNYSEKLTGLVHHFWESHLRLEKMSVDQAEAFAVANVRAIQVQLLREKSKRIKERGAKSKDDQIVLCFDKYTCDKETILHLINKTPFHRSGFNAKREERRLALEHFLTKGEGKGISLALDTTRGVKYNNSDSKLPKDSKFISEVQKIVGYGTDVFASSLERNNRKPKKDVLPELLIDFRRLTICGQYLMHPESTLHQAFDSSGMMGDIERQKWLLDQFSKVATDEMTDDQASKGLFVEEWKVRMATIRKMGSPIKFRVHHTSAEEQNDKCVVAYSGSHKLEFQPTGVLFNDNRYPFHDESMVGKKGTIPKSYLETLVGKKDEKFKVEKFLNKERPRDQQVKRSLTEITTWLLEEYDPSIPEIDLVLNAKLRGLELQDIGNSEKASINSIYNVFDIIFNRPDILDNPAIARVLELAIYRTGAIHKILQKNPFYFDKGQIGAKLKYQIEQAVKMERRVAVGFLLQLSESLKEQTQLAKEIAEDAKHPFVKGENQKFLNEKQQVLDKVLKEIPDLNTSFNIGKKEKVSTKTGLHILQEWANNAQYAPTTRKHLYTTLLDYYRRMTGDGGEKLAQLSALDWAHIVQAYYFIKYSGEDAGCVPIQGDIKRWFEGHALAYLTQNIMVKETQRKEVLTAHWLLSETGKAEIPAQLPNWQSVDSYSYEIKGKKIRTSLLTGVVSINGKAQGFETIIPCSIVKKEEYQNLFGKKSLPSTAFADPSFSLYILI